MKLLISMFYQLAEEFNRDVKRSNTNNMNTILKLPEIPFPLFSGKIKELLKFQTQIKSLIVKNESLTNTRSADVNRNK